MQWRSLFRIALAVRNVGPWCRLSGQKMKHERAGIARSSAIGRTYIMECICLSQHNIYSESCVADHHMVFFVCTRNGSARRRLSTHRAQPESTRSSCTTKSLTLNSLAKSVSRIHSTQPARRKNVVKANHTTAHAAPAKHPTKTCLGVW